MKNTLAENLKHNLRVVKENEKLNSNLNGIQLNN
jgi:hypothetical protein